MQQPIKVISSVGFEKLKKRARNLKRGSELSHTEALEQVARSIGFDNWHQVTQAHGLLRPSETAFKKGCVVAFDVRDGMDFDTSDGAFIDDHLMPLVCRDVVYELFTNRPDEEDPDGRPIKETQPASELQLWFDEVMDDYLFFRLREDLARNDKATVIALIRDRTFWMPQCMWLRGQFVDTYGLSPEDENGHPTGIRL